MPARSTTSDLADDRAAAMRLTPVSRETRDRLDILVDLLLAWNRTTNLIADSTIPHLWTRHVSDSLQLMSLVPAARIWIDLGSGAGFPGLVVACALADTAGATAHLVESNSKKAAFLREAARLTGTPAVIHGERIEKFVDAFSGPVDVVTARALAPLKVLLNHSFKLIEQGALGLFPKGRAANVELTDATQSWNIKVNLVPSRTDSQGHVVMVHALERRAAAG
jgi:16S rRNA (guanine527-N7)-methyltransferase